MRSSDTDYFVMLVDSRELRGAGFLSLLAGWAESKNIHLVSKHSSDVVTALSGDTKYDMIIVSLGGSTVAEKSVATEIKVIKALSGDASMVVMSDRAELEEIRSVLMLGAQGFLPSSMPPELAIATLSFILNGGSYFPPDVVRDALSRDSQVPSSGSVDGKNEAPPSEAAVALPASIRRNPDTDSRNADVHFGQTEERQEARDLTPRQEEVLVLLGVGKPNKVIARELGMTEATVKVHVRQIMRKFGVDNRTQAALCATSIGFPVVRPKNWQSATSSGIHAPARH